MIYLDHPSAAPQPSSARVAEHVRPPENAAATPNYHLERPSRSDRTRYTFTHKWFDKKITHWQELTQPLRGKRLDILEVGSFEGGSTTWLLDNLMDAENSTLTAIDSFEGGNESAPSEYDVASLEQQFYNNVKLSQNYRKLKVKKGYSTDVLPQLKVEKAAFDFIYIDGSHMAIDVLHDAVLAWSMLREGGTIVFDDYTWDLYKQEFYRPHLAIASFLRCVAPTVRWQERSGQVWAQKVPNYIPAQRKR